MSSLAWVCWAALSVLSSGCGPYIGDVNAQHRNELEAKLQQIAKLDAVVKATPLVEGNVPTRAKLSLSLHPLHQAPDNAALIYVEDLENLDEQGIVESRLPMADLISKCSAGLHTERAPWQAKYAGDVPLGLRGAEAEQLYPACERLEYVLVLRTRAFVKPELLPIAPLAAESPSDAGAPDDAEAGAAETDAEPLEGGVPKLGQAPKAPKASKAKRARGVDAGLADAGSDAGVDGGADAAPGAETKPAKRHRFMGGYLDAEVLVFELAGSRLVGAFRFSAESSEAVEGYAKGYEVFEDFQGRIHESLRKAMNENAPDSFRLTVGGGK